MSKPKCKLNDVCFILKAIRRVNLGKVVETVEYLGHFKKDESFIWNGEVWRTAITDHHWVIKGNLDTAYGNSKLSYIADSWLLPMKPEDSWLLPMKPEDSGEGVYELESTPEDIAA